MLPMMAGKMSSTYAGGTSRPACCMTSCFVLQRGHHFSRRYVGFYRQHLCSPALTLDLSMLIETYISARTLWVSRGTSNNLVVSLLSRARHHTTECNIIMSPFTTHEATPDDESVLISECHAIPISNSTNNWSTPRKRI